MERDERKRDAPTSEEDLTLTPKKRPGPPRGKSNAKSFRSLGTPECDPPTQGENE